MSQPPASHYIHGTSDEEQHRLGLMNRLLNEPYLREMSLAHGDQVLELGSGTAIFARMMARATGAVHPVVCIEREAAQREKAIALARSAGEERLIDLRGGSAFELPLSADEWGSFDVVHARFLLEHVPDPAGVVAQMLLAARPGGRLIVSDDDHSVFRITPEPRGWPALWSAYMSTYERAGNDPRVGRQLVTLLARAGARPKRNTCIFFGSCAGHENFVVVAENLRLILEGARDELLRASLISERDYSAAMAAYAAWSTLPDAAAWYAIDWAEAVRP
jgi:SAM-dependent methyltransferase